MNTKSIMEDAMQELSTNQSDTRKTTMKSWCRVAWILILLADVGLLAWGAMAAVAPEHLLGPNSAPILNAEYEGFTGNSWPELASTSPATTEFMTIVFRMYGIYGVAFSLMAIAITVTAFRRGDGWAWWALLVGNTLTYVAAMRYDWIMRAIGPFEVTEYLGLAAAYLAVAFTAPFLAAGRTVRSTD
ncbi:MAG TPA: hypothetical protein VK249_11745 [Anaerolineales bacterium]|nr:hypothetical protein [Anaerolineales bacterium]